MVIHKRRPQEWGRQWRIKGGGRWGRAVLGGGAKFQLFLGCRKSHKGKIHASKKSRQKYLYGWGKKISSGC